MSDPIDTDRTKRADIAATAIALGSELERVKAERDELRARLSDTEALIKRAVDVAIARFLNHSVLTAFNPATFKEANPNRP